MPLKMKTSISQVRSNTSTIQATRPHMEVLPMSGLDFGIAIRGTSRCAPGAQQVKKALADLLQVAIKVLRSTTLEHNNSERKVKLARVGDSLCGSHMVIERWKT